MTDVYESRCKEFRGARAVTSECARARTALLSILSRIPVHGAIIPVMYTCSTFTPLKVLLIGKISDYRYVNKDVVVYRRQDEVDCLLLGLELGRVLNRHKYNINSIYIYIL